ncbi:MAG: sulfite exporter TauE/SafE family protein [Planctomycetota bacterium]
MTLFVAVFLVGVVAGVVNTMSGGGTYLMLPLLVFCGLEPKVANATNRFAVAFQAVAGAVTLHRRGVVRWRVSVVPTVIAAVGGVAGALLTTRLDPAGFRTVAGWVLLGGIFLLFVQPRRAAAPATAAGAGDGGRSRSELRQLRWGGLLATFVVGVYGGFIGAAVGVVILVFLPRLLGLDLVQGVAVKTLMVFAFSASASVVYIGAGLVEFAASIPVILGYIIGGVLGARLTVAVGDIWVRRIVALVGAGLALAMILGAS